jgi:hypothetical protein
MRWKLPQQYEHIGRPSLSLRWRTRLLHRGQRKKLQEPPFGKRRCASLTSRLSSIAPKLPGTGPVMGREGIISFSARRKRQVRIAWLRLSPQSPRFKSELEISLAQPCGLERL